MPPKKKSIVDKENDENKSILKTMELKKQRKLPVIKFDMARILKERQADVEYWKKSAELDEKMKIVDDLFKSEENMRVSLIPNLEYVIFDQTKYNLFFKENPDYYKTQLHLQQLHSLSIEEDELEAKILFNHLMKANWSPVLNEVKNIFYNWGADVDTLINKPLLKSQIYDNGKIGHQNFELILTYIQHSILKNNNGFNNNDLLTLAKFILILSFDHHYGKMISVIKKLFNACVEAALDADDEMAILAFAQELYAKYSLDDLLTLVVDFFLPLEGLIMNKMYTYLAYKLFKALLEKTNNIDSFPSSIKDWFVHDLVNEVYFKIRPKSVINNILQLLEHVVFTFDLWEDDEGLNKIYEFLNAILRSHDSSKFHHLFYILDQWKMQLFRLHVKNVKIELERSFY